MSLNTHMSGIHANKILAGLVGWVAATPLCNESLMHVAMLVGKITSVGNTSTVSSSLPPAPARHSSTTRLIHLKTWGYDYLKFQPIILKQGPSWEGRHQGAHLLGCTHLQVLPLQPWAASKHHLPLQVRAGGT